ncbi:MAG: hypothetical protein WAL67_14500 [Candidatus Cybelea sp.]
MLLRRCVLRFICGATVLTGALALLAGCGGSQPQMTPLGFTQTNSVAAGHSSMDPDSRPCPPQKGAVRVTPCRVHLTASKPGPVTLSLKTPHGSKGTVREHDVCEAQGIATITGSGDTWTVTAGPNHGKCLANFAYSNNGHKVQYGRAFIRNRT